MSTRRLILTAPYWTTIVGHVLAVEPPKDPKQYDSKAAESKRARKAQIERNRGRK